MIVTYGRLITIYIALMPLSTTDVACISWILREESLTVKGKPVKVIYL
jgi:hypothetical protein